MKRATITLPDELEARVDTFLRQQEPEPSLTALIQAALRNYLDEMEWTGRAFTPPRRRLRVTPAEGSGATDTAARHDEVLADRS